MEPEALRAVGQEYDLAMPPARTLRALAEAISILDTGDGTYTIVSENGVYEFDPETGCGCPDQKHNDARCKHRRAFEHRNDPAVAQELQASLGTALLEVQDAIDEVEAELRRLQTAKWTLERHLDTARGLPATEADRAAPASAAPSVGDGARTSAQPVTGD